MSVTETQLLFELRCAAGKYGWQADHDTTGAPVAIVADKAQGPDSPAGISAAAVNAPEGRLRH